MQLLNVDLGVEKTLEPEDEGAFAKLGSTISNLFKSGDEKPDVETPPPAPIEEPQQENNTTTPPKSDEVPKNETNTNTTENASKDKKDQPKKPKSVIIKEKIDAEVKPIGLPPLNENQIETSKGKIEKLNIVDRNRLARETALNNLESFVIETQNKLFNDEFMEASTDAEVTKIQEMCAQISEWLYEDGENADAETYKKRLEEVQGLSRPLYTRVYEHKERPEALAALASMLNGSETFLASAKNLTTGKNLDAYKEIKLL